MRVLCGYLCGVGENTAKNKTNGNKIHLASVPAGSQQAKSMTQAKPISA